MEENKLWSGLDKIQTHVQDWDSIIFEIDDGIRIKNATQETTSPPQCCSNFDFSLYNDDIHTNRQHNLFHYSRRDALPQYSLYHHNKEFAPTTPLHALESIH